MRLFFIHRNRQLSGARLITGHPERSEGSFFEQNVRRNDYLRHCICKILMIK